MPPNNPNPDDDNKNTKPFTSLNRLIESDIRSILSQAEEIRSQLFTFDSNIRPHIEKSIEEVQKDKLESWRRFGDRYERSTNPERKAIEPRTGTQAEKDRIEYEKRRLEEDGFDPRHFHSWGGWPFWGWHGHGNDRWGWHAERSVSTENHDREEYESRGRWSRCKRERQQERQRQREVEGDLKKREQEMRRERERNQQQQQQQLEHQIPQRPEPHPFDALFALEPSLAQHFAHHLGLEQHENSTTWQPSDTYLRRNPYSPLRLENEGVTAQKGQYWRNAFEDLLVESNPDGTVQKYKKANAETQQSAAGSTNANAAAGRQESWIEHVMRIGVSAPAPTPSPSPAAAQARTQPAAASAAVTASSKSQKEANSELELYEYFLQGLNTHGSTSPSPSHPQPQPQLQSQSQQRRSSTAPQDFTQLQKQKQSQSPILSTTTTTTTQTLPDGTEIKRTVFRKRFTDGSETVEQKSDVRHGSRRQAGPAGAGTGVEASVKWKSAIEDGGVKKDREVKGKEEGRSRGGWFWSNE